MTTACPRGGVWFRRGVCDALLNARVVPPPPSSSSSSPVSSRMAAYARIATTAVTVRTARGAHSREWSCDATGTCEIVNVGRCEEAGHIS
jgi:hypothetical protein